MNAAAVTLRRCFCSFTTTAAITSPPPPSPPLSYKKKPLVFLGSPQVSTKVLDALLTASESDNSIFKLAAFVTQPPSQRDRGRKLMPSPVAQYVLDRGFPEDLILTPECAGEGWMLKRLSITVILANALVMAAPFEALAETCEADNSFFNMPLLLSVALIGATVGGLLARQRKAELQRVNEQLRQINAALRRQAKIESYAPTLSYAPASARISESEVIVDPRKHELISRLKSGKNYLRNQNPEKAFEEFKEALQLAQSLNDPTEEKKAARGLGASLQRQLMYREAIKYHSMVLSVSEREGEDSGNAEAYGAIADCYTELGELEKAGKFYDQYIALLQTD